MTATGTAEFTFNKTAPSIAYHVALKPPTDSDPAPAFVTRQDSNGSGGFGTVKAPAGTQIGDIIIVEGLLTVSGPSSFTWPLTDFQTGWNILAEPQVGDAPSGTRPSYTEGAGDDLFFGGLWWKFADASDASGSPPTYSTGGQWASIAVYRGTHVSVPIDGFGVSGVERVFDGGTPCSPSALSIAVTGPNRRLIAIARLDGPSLPLAVCTSWPTGYTARNTAFQAIGIADKEFSALVASSFRDYCGAVDVI